MTKYFKHCIFSLYLLSFACFFEARVLPDLSIVSGRDCFTLERGTKFQPDNKPFSRILRLKGRMNQGEEVFAGGFTLSRPRLLKSKNDTNYFILPRANGGPLGFGAKTVATHQACILDYFSYAKNLYALVSNDFYEEAPSHPLGGYLLFFLLLAVNLIAVSYGTPSSCTLFMAPAAVLFTALALIPPVYGVKIYIALPLFAEFAGLSYLAALVYQLRNRIKELLSFLFAPVNWPAPSAKEGMAWGLGIAAAAAFFYWPMFSHIFRHDEWFYFFTFRGGPQPLLKYIDWQMFLPSDRLMFRPLHHSMLAFNMLAFGDNYTLPHVVSFFKHLTATALLAACLWRIYPHRLAFLFTGLFALMATQIDAVAWAHVDAYIVSTIYILGAALLFLEAAEDKLSPAKGFGLSSLLLLAGMLTTELSFPASFIFFASYWSLFRRPGHSASRDKASALYLATFLCWGILFALHLWKTYPDFNMTSQSGHSTAGRAIYNALFSFLLSVTRFFPLLSSTFSSDKIYVKSGLYIFILTTGLLAAAAFRFRRHLKLNKEACLYSALAFAPCLILAVGRAGYINSMLTDYLPFLYSPTHYTYISNAFTILAAYAFIGRSMSLKPRLSAAILLSLCLWHGVLLNASLRRISTELRPFKEYYTRLSQFVSAHKGEKDFSFKLVRRLELNLPFNWYSSSFPETFYGDYMRTPTPKYLAEYDYAGRILRLSPAGEYPVPAPVPPLSLKRTKSRPEFLNRIGMDFIRVSMGPSAIYAGVTEVTRAQWAKVMGSNPPAHASGQASVSNISWNGANEFIRRLNAAERTAGYRLPTAKERDAIAMRLLLGQHRTKSEESDARNRRYTLCAWLSASITTTEIYTYPDTPRLCSGMVFMNDGRSDIYAEAYPPSYSFYNTGLRVVRDIR